MFGAYLHILWYPTIFCSTLRSGWPVRVNYVLSRFGSDFYTVLSMLALISCSFPSHICPSSPRNNIKRASVGVCASSICACVENPRAHTTSKYALLCGGCKHCVSKVFRPAYKFCPGLRNTHLNPVDIFILACPSSNLLAQTAYEFVLEHAAAVAWLKLEAPCQSQQATLVWISDSPTCV